MSLLTYSALSCTEGCSQNIICLFMCCFSNDYAPKEDGREESINLQAVGEGRVQLFRTPQEKDRLPDRISLDRYM